MFPLLRSLILIGSKKNKTSKVPNIMGLRNHMIRKTIKSTNREHYACSRLVPQEGKSLHNRKQKRIAKIEFCDPFYL